MAEPLREFTRFSWWKCRTAPSGRRPKTKPDDLGCESACTGCQNLHPPLPFISITQPESWYLFYRPTEGRKLSRPSDCMWLTAVEGRRCSRVETEALQQARLLQPLSEHAAWPRQAGPPMCLWVYVFCYLNDLAPRHLQFSTVQSLNYQWCIRIIVVKKCNNN